MKGDRRCPTPTPAGPDAGDGWEALSRRLSAIEEALATVLRHLREGAAEPFKEWYSTTEVATAMGVTVYTMSARWCAEGRVEAVKDRQTGKWKIPGHEYRRLVRGGGLRPKAG
ncbi:MAG: hypothetical protein U0792_11750 [Gemmataceae bacterium]